MAHPNALRNILAAPASLRPLLLQHSRIAAYHSYEHVDPPPYRDTEDKILSSALRHVPVHGFTTEALTLGAKEQGYLDISRNLFPKSAFELVKYHLVTQRVDLKNRIQFPDSQTMGVGRKVRSLVLARLRANVDAGIVPRW